MSYAAALMRRFLDALHLPLSLRINIGSFVWTSSVSIDAIMAFAIHPISSVSLCLNFDYLQDKLGGL